MNSLEIIINPITEFINKNKCLTPKKVNYAKLRQEALANILGQSNKDYFCLQHKNNKKGVNSQLFDVNAAKKFFEYTL